jgi:hypothetical protein
MNITPVRKICIGLADEEVLSKNKLRRHLSLVERAFIAEEHANVLNGSNRGSSRCPRLVNM